MRRPILAVTMQGRGAHTSRPLVLSRMGGYLWLRSPILASTTA
jgi:hypothetical protein